MTHYKLIALAFCLVAHSSYSQNKTSLIDRLNHYSEEQSDSLEWFLTTELLPQSRSEKNDELVITGLTQLINYYFANNQFESASPYVKELIQFQQYRKDSIGLSTAYQLKGTLQFNLNQQEEALEWYYKSIAISPEKSSHHYATYGYIARILQNNRDAENAIKYHNQALAGALAKEDWNSYVKTCLNLCILYNGKATINLDSSAYYGLKALETAKIHDLAHMAAHATNIVAAPVIRLGQYKKGLALTKQSIELGKQYPLFPGSDYVQLINLGFAYLGLKQLDSAELMVKKAIALKPGRSDNFRLYSEIFAAKGNDRKALEYHQLYKDKSDSVLEANFQRKFSQNQSRLEANQKEQEVAELEQQALVKELELRQQRLIVIGLSVLVILVIGFGYLFIRQQRIQKEHQMSDMEQRLLRAQMNPHFIFNSMTAIQHYMLTKGAEQASHYMGTFSKLMRQILEHSRSEFISLGEEVETLNNYLELQQMRFNDRFTYEIIVDEELDEEYYHLPPMFAQPFIENSLEHGLFHKEGQDNHIKVSFEPGESDSIILTIEDTGIGIQQAAASKEHKSLATQITKERLTLFQKSLSWKSQLTIENITNSNGEVSGLLVNLALPVKVIVNS